MNLASHVLFASGASDDKLALVVLGASGAERWSYGRLRTRVMATAGGLKAAGLAPGNRLLIRLGNSPDFPIVYLAAIAAGIIPVPTSSALGEEEIGKIAHDLAPDAIAAEEGIALPKGTYRTLSPAELADAEPLDAMVETDSNAPAYIVYTSGTSGTPLGVVHAHRAILARRMMFDGWYGLREDDRMLHAGAFNWTFTLGTGLMDPWTMGATSLVLKDGTKARPAAAAGETARSNHSGRGARHLSPPSACGPARPAPPAPRIGRRRKAVRTSAPDPGKTAPAPNCTKPSGNRSVPPSSLAHRAALPLPAALAMPNPVAALRSWTATHPRHAARSVKSRFTPLTPACPLGISPARWNPGANGCRPATWASCAKTVPSNTTDAPTTS